MPALPRRTDTDWTLPLVELASVSAASDPAATVGLLIGVFDAGGSALPTTTMMSAEPSSASRGGHA